MVSPGPEEGLVAIRSLQTDVALSPLEPSAPEQFLQTRIVFWRRLGGSFGSG